MNELIDDIMSALTDSRWDVGDHQFPKNAGWQGDQITGTFKPFVVAYFSGSTDIDGSFGSPESEQRLSVTLNLFGAKRSQTTQLADVVRPLLKDLNQTLHGDYFVQYVALDIIGSVQRLDSWDKPLFLITDRYTLFTTQ